jgi:hypothetical protein
MPVSQIHPLMLVAGQSASIQVRQIEKVSTLADVEFRICSQFGEDGIIEWLVHRLDIDTPSFVEIGASNYDEANTRFLLENRNWGGLLIDADPRISELRNSPLWWRQDINAIQSFVSAENIDSLIRSANFGGQIGLLSIDIDGMDYWIWNAICAVSPILVVCEYNGVFGDLVPIVVPYDQKFERMRAHPSNVYWGASISALEMLAKTKDYDFLGTNSTGHNAFFVRRDYKSRLVGRIESSLPRVSLIRTPRSGFAGGLARFELIADLPVIDLRDGATRKLRELRPIYSDRWLKALG